MRKSSYEGHFGRVCSYRLLSFGKMQRRNDPDAREKHTLITQHRKQPSCFFSFLNLLSSELKSPRRRVEPPPPEPLRPPAASVCQARVPPSLILRPPFHSVVAVHNHRSTEEVEGSPAHILITQTLKPGNQQSGLPEPQIPRIPASFTDKASYEYRCKIKYQQTGSSKI